MKYNWNIDSLKTDLDNLIKIRDSEENLLIRDKYDSYIAHIKLTILSEQYKSKNNVDFQNNAFEISTNCIYYEFFFDYIYKFLDITKKFYNRDNKEEPTNFKKTVISHEDSFSLTHDFFKQLDTELFDLFCKLYRQKTNCYKFIRMNKQMSVEGSVLFIPGVKKVYIEQANIPNVTKLSTMAHEYGHGVAALLNNERYIRDTSLFNEIESIFIELLSREYYKSVINYEGFDLDTVMQTEKYIEMGYSLMDAKIGGEIFLTNDFPLYKDFKKLVKLEKDFECIIDLFKNEYSVDADLTYALSFVVAVELFEIYKNDKEKALYLLKKYIMLQENELRTIEKDIILNEHMGLFCDNVEKQMKKTYKL